VGEERMGVEGSTGGKNESMMGIGEEDDGSWAINTGEDELSWSGIESSKEEEEEDSWAINNGGDDDDDESSWLGTEPGKEEEEDDFNGQNDDKKWEHNEFNMA
jgi:hypothetical protein